MPSYDLEKVLLYCGFSKDLDGHYEIKFKGGFIKAYRYWDVPGYVYNLFGNYNTGREMGEIDNTIPELVEDFNEGLALVAYYLRNVTPIIYYDWMQEGRIKRNFLPWVKQWEEEKIKWNKTPKAILTHEFYKLILQKVKKHIQTNECDLVFSFNQPFFKITSANFEVGCLAKGVSWENEIIIKSMTLENWPKRIVKQDHIIYIMNNHLHFANNRILIS